MQKPLKKQTPGIVRKLGISLTQSPSQGNRLTHPSEGPCFQTEAASGQRPPSLSHGSWS